MESASICAQLPDAISKSSEALIFARMLDCCCGAKTAAMEIIVQKNWRGDLESELSSDG
jgi:hypothetical protein